MQERAVRFGGKTRSRHPPPGGCKMGGDASRKRCCMTEINPMTASAAATAQPGEREAHHPSTFVPATFVLLVILSVFGAVIGVQLILQLGITPNTSIIGALVAMLLARIPGALFARYRSIHVQNLAQRSEE